MSVQGRCGATAAGSGRTGQTSRVAAPPSGHQPPRAAPGRRAPSGSQPAAGPRRHAPDHGAPGRAR